MLKKSFLFFGLSVLVFLVLIIFFAIAGLTFGEMFWEYAIYVFPFLAVPSIVLSIFGVKYGRQARIESNNALSSIFANICNITFLIFLIFFTVGRILFISLTLIFAS